MTVSPDLERVVGVTERVGFDWARVKVKVEDNSKVKKSIV